MIEFNFSPFPIIQTERLTLSRITRDDAQAILDLRSDVEGRRHLDRIPPKSIDEIYELIGKIEEGISTNERIAWAISKKENQKFMGMISFHNTYRQHHRAEMGYQLMTEYWNQGIMSEAIKAVIEFGFTKMNLHSIEAHTNPNNATSIHLLLKHNFVQEALFKENYFFNGEFIDTPVFSLLNRRT